MRPGGVVVASPSLALNLGLAQRRDSGHRAGRRWSGASGPDQPVGVDKVTVGQKAIAGSFRPAMGLVFMGLFPASPEGDVTQCANANRRSNEIDGRGTILPAILNLVVG